MEIDVPLVRHLIAAQFPQWSDLSITPVEPNGWDNRTFRLGNSMSVRLPSAECYAAQVDKEHRWLPILAPLLPLTIPVPLARGLPTEHFPWNWSIYRWLEGENAAVEHINDMEQFAVTLAQFLIALWKIDAANGPVPGSHNFFRGGPLATYDRETRNAIASLSGQINTDAATELWETALTATLSGKSVWVHGDIHPTNLLVCGGYLRSVIDFGCLGVGDPSCDLTIAWTLFSGDSRRTFHKAVNVDDATWARSRAWALWKASITLAGMSGNVSSLQVAKAQQIIDDVLTEFQHMT